LSEFFSEYKIYYYRAYVKKKEEEGQHQRPRPPDRTNVDKSKAVKQGNRVEGRQRKKQGRKEARRREEQGRRRGKREDELLWIQAEACTIQPLRMRTHIARGNTGASGTAVSGT